MTNLIINREAFGQRLKAIRLSKGMTLEEFGTLFGAEKSNVSKWEKGKSLPSPERLKKISKISGYSVSELLYGNIFIFFREYFKNYLPDEKKYLKNYISNSTFETIIEEMKDRDIDYFEIENLDKLSERLLIQSDRELYKDIENARTVITENPKEFLEVYNELDNHAHGLGFNYSSPNELKNDIFSDDMDKLVEISILIDTIVFHINLIHKREFSLIEVETTVILKEDLGYNFEIDDSNATKEKIKLLKYDTSVKGYDRIISIYENIFSKLYVIAWYDNETPLIDKKQYLFYSDLNDLVIGYYSESDTKEGFYEINTYKYYAMNKVKKYFILLAEMY
ncbi:helix-turn-helix domain-containing protein [Streptococcus uberis]|uniref:helix-turn-helix domain-containing protein n=1 Tax=Streptococcus uberis TaxID=1349 RepID=UPI00193AA06D|nr:helix-turn-helix domain-containing protein [Streptococcus uberis]